MRRFAFFGLALFVVPGACRPNPPALESCAVSFYPKPVADLTTLTREGGELPGQSVAKLAVPAGVIAAGLTLSVSQNARDYFKDRWERFMSPNHADPSNQGEFRYRTREEERSQSTQCDKLVHVYFSYLPVGPVSLLCEYLFRGLPPWLGGITESEGVSGRSKVLAFLLVSAGGLLEEYVDGYEIDEGFSREDMACNLLGAGFSLLKGNLGLDWVNLYWTFNGVPSGYGWPWWTYMDGYEFRVQVDLFEFFFREKQPQNPPFKWWMDTVGYLPSFYVLTLENDLEYSRPWER